MKWYLVDDCTTRKAGMWVQPLEAETREEAEREARREWDSLTTFDKKERDEFWVALAGEDEDGGMDWESVAEVITIKERV